MDMNVNDVNGIKVITLGGRFDAFEVPPLIKWFEDNVSDTNSRVIVDLGGVGFLDSAALASLVKGMKRCRERSGDLVLCNLQQAVRIIFELTGLHKAFTLVDTREAALKVF